jgi:hypothetical protein
VADGWCWFVLREEYWLVAGGWFVLREKYCWLVTDKPSEQGACWRGFASLQLSTAFATILDRCFFGCANPLADVEAGF